MSIPINDISPRIQYTAAAAQTVFIVPFPFFVNSDLAVWLTPAGTTADDPTDILALTTDYTVTGAGNANGGTITLVAPATANDIVTINRDMPEQRLSLYLPGGLFTADQVNDDFSMDVMMNQQNEMHESLLTPHYYNSAVVGDQDLILPILGAGQTWVMNSTVTRIEAATVTSVTPSPTPSSLSQLIVAITQAGHGFVVGDLVRVSGINTFAKAQADSAANAEVIGIVSAVAGVNDFTLMMNGLITGLAGLTAGTSYYLSPTTAGLATATRPTAPTQVVKPVFVAVGAASAIWLNMLGVVL